MDHNDRDEILSDFYDAEVRCEAMWPLFMCLADTLPSGLEETLTNADGVFEALGLSDDEIAEIKESDYRPDVITDIIQRTRRIGFLAKFASPIPFDFKGDGSVYCSGWGYYTNKWFYSADLKDLGQKALEWAKADFAARKVRALEGEGL